MTSANYVSVSDLVGKAHNQDCLDLMASIPASSVQMLFADPPFNLRKKYSSYKDDLPFNEYIEWTEQWLKESLRVLREDGSLFVYNIPKLLTHTASMLNPIADFKHWIAWNSAGKPLGKTLQPAHYGILFYGKTSETKFYDIRKPHEKCRKCGNYLKDYGGKEYLRHDFGYQISDVWNDIHRTRHRSKRIDTHPCQLPIHLPERLILMATDPDDIVLDIFCGGGSAAIAAKQLGRKYIGCDIDEGYCEATSIRYEEAEETKQNGKFVSFHRGDIVSVRDCDIDFI